MTISTRHDLIPSHLTTERPAQIEFYIFRAQRFSPSESARENTLILLKYFTIYGILQKLVVNRTISANFSFIYILEPIIFKEYFIFYHFHCISLVLKPCELPLLLFILLGRGHCPYFGQMTFPRVKIYKGSNSTPCIFLLYQYSIIILLLSLETITAIYLKIIQYSIDISTNPSVTYNPLQKAVILLPKQVTLPPPVLEPNTSYLDSSANSITNRFLLFFSGKCSLARMGPKNIVENLPSHPIYRRH